MTDPKPLHRRHTWTSEGTLGMKLKPASGDKDSPQGVFCAQILNADIGIPAWVTDDSHCKIHEVPLIEESRHVVVDG